MAQDAAVALAQSLSVLAARETWKKGDKAEAVPANKVDDPKRKLNEVDHIFRDSGMGARMELETPNRLLQWCGMFVGTHLFRGGGLDEEIRKGMLDTANVKDYFQYPRDPINETRNPRSIWADGQWWNLKGYHAARGSLRKWTSHDAITGPATKGQSVDIRPGDVVLIEYIPGKGPKHITMAESYDPAAQRLVTIEGNITDVALRSNVDGDVERNKQDGSYVNPGRAAGPAAVVMNIRHLDRADGTAHAQADKLVPPGAYHNRRASEVYGIGRPSAADFEEHSYADRDIPAELQHISPDEMRALAARQGITDKTEEHQQQTVKNVHLKPEQ